MEIDNEERILHPVNLRVYPQVNLSQELRRLQIVDSEDESNEAEEAKSESLNSVEQNAETARLSEVRVEGANLHLKQHPMTLKDIPEFQSSEDD